VHVIEDLVTRAQAGDQEAIGDLLESYRAYLRAIAQRRIAGSLRPRVDASDLVQQTMLDAHRGLNDIITDQESHLRATLRKILTCNVANAIRDHVYAEKRRLNRESPVEGIANHQPASIASPSVQLVNQENVERFVTLLDGLPDDQSTAIRMRYFESASVGEIGETLGRSRVAAAGLLKRGLARLREQLSQDSL